MKITVFGCGYVGLTTAVGLAEIGNEVIGIDTDRAKIQSLQKGHMPFYEPGLKELLTRNIAEKRLHFSSDQKFGIEQSDVIFSAVGTPPQKDQNADLTAVLKVAEAFALHLTREKIFINKSTVPVGTSEKIRKTIEARQTLPAPFAVVSNPEFLREGSAVDDFFKPDRIIVGLKKNDPKVRKLIKTLYRPITNNGIPLMFTDIRSSEIIKYASNAFLATKLSFINELANFCDSVGGDIKEVSKGMGYDKRIGPDFFEAGIGFGGSCLPKDLHALIETGAKHGHSFQILKAARNVNLQQPSQLLKLLHGKFRSLRGRKIAIWGLSFKPNTDDIREAPSLKIIDHLLEHKAKITVFDPAAAQNVQAIFGKKISYAASAYRALEDAEALLILTEWNEFRSPDFGKMVRLMRTAYVFDGRNIYDPEEIRTHGLEYFSIGQGKNIFHPPAQPSMSLSAVRRLKSNRSRVRLGL